MHTSARPLLLVAQLLLLEAPRTQQQVQRAGAGAGSHCHSYYGCYPRPHPRRENSYLPAPPGKTPRCARPGATFCETADHYPTHLVRHLIDRWAFDFNTLLERETIDDFYLSLPVSYGPPSGTFGTFGPFGPFGTFGPPPSDAPPPAANHSHALVYTPAAAYGPPAPTPAPASAPGHGPASQDNPDGYPDRRYRLDLALTDITNAPPAVDAAEAGTGTWRAWRQQQSTNPNVAGPAAWARFRRDASRPPSRERQRRQAGAGAGSPTTLCPTSSSFVTPQAALNTKGNWMFVANVPELADRTRYTQLVRTETCISSECDGICSLPLGYASRCEQQFVQKRLVALGAAGDRLYTDTFWFPHCCVCQITPNSSG